MSKKFSLLLAIVLIASLVLSACSTTAAPKATGKKICQVTDTGGIDDKSFNATAWKGATDAQKELGFEAKYSNHSNRQITIRTSMPSLKRSAT